MELNYSDIAGMIDHSLLKPTLTDRELEEGCRLAVRYAVASVCILPHAAATAVRLLLGSDVVASTTVGFPHGGHATKTKLAEAAIALDDGCLELDMVVNIGKILSGDCDYVRDEIAILVELTHSRGARLKVIFENCYLGRDQKIRLCQICSETKADWVKTSTGYGSGGSTIEDLVLMRRYSDASVQVKAAGGIRTLDQVLEVRAAGATRIGASQTAAILDDWRLRLNMKPIDGGSVTGIR